jgi:dimeric dUTPase (all-alpha-NTP-PPase superfamily)
MDLTKLFEKQRELDERIVKEHELDPKIFDWKIDAIRVELHELENEVRHFKKWSKDQSMRTGKALVEYVDVLHFMISYSISIGVTIQSIDTSFKCQTVTEQFREIAYQLSMLYIREEKFLDTFQLILGLGEMLGFTWEQIEQAYYSKNQVNHERQANGY